MAERDPEPQPAPQKTPGFPTASRDRVESPQQYPTWREYAFSEEPESDFPLRP